MEKELILLVGPIGSGKTTFAESLRTDCSVRISQDEMGKGGHLVKFKEAIRGGTPRVIIDRMGFNVEQRMRYITPARQAGYSVSIFEFAFDWDICFKRAVSRRGHPTIAEGNSDLVKKVLNMYRNSYQQPSDDEFDNYNKVVL